MANRNTISADGDELGATEGNDRILGTDDKDKIDALGGDDLVEAGSGNDSVRGAAGFDAVYGEEGNDKLFGGTGIDLVYGGRGDDWLWGDEGKSFGKGLDLSSDVLDGAQGRDTLVQSDGNDVMSGGKAADVFLFRWNDPSVELAAGTGRAFTKITDFDASRDQLHFDVAGVGEDFADANFLDGGAGDGTAGGKAASLFVGSAADSDGQAVMVLTDQAFDTGANAVLAAENESVGDLILYYNSTVNAASLLYVDGPNVAHSILRLTNINSVQELADQPWGANDFVFV